MLESLPVVSEEDVVHTVRLLGVKPPLLVRILLDVSRHALEGGPPAVP